MLMRRWRISKGLSLADMARALGIAGKNPGGTLARFEQGSRHPESDMIERIEAYTDGAVTAADMHAARLAWLKENRPEKFSRAAISAAAEARP